MSPIVRFGVLFGAGIVLLSTPISGFFLTRIFLEARASAGWPHVEGTLEKAEVKEIGLGLPRRYGADVLYSYQVSGVNYRGKRVRISDGEADRREAIEDKLRGLVAGEPVTVYYDPERKSKSVLQPGVGFQEWFLLGIPVVMFAIGAFGIRRALAARRGC